MKSAVSRGVVAVSVVAVLGLTAGCSGSGEGDGAGDGGGKPSKSAQAPDGSSGASSAVAKLQKAALASGDVKKYEVEKAPAKAAGQGRVTPAECRPLSDWLDANAPQKSTAHVSRTLTSTDVSDGTATEVVLFAYDRADAEKAMDTLRAATKSKKCATFGDGSHRYFGTRPQPAPVGGDEAVSYKLANRADEFLERHRVSVVRSGSTVIAFRAVNIFDPESVGEDAGGDKGRGGGGATADPEVAEAIVDAQLAKLAGTK
ncbi:hypothetical protein AB0Q95_31885 [Streptomyces sp. NPDC059900]|uniref:hypothetical protein n=1 Tax=Streptomyces sp. NPDC059900 TaxID=3155816 RepID=UPI00344349E0